jgi:hypothetical protein
MTPTPGHIHILQRHAAMYLRDSCDIVPVTATVTDAGGTKTTPGTPVMVACRVAPVGSVRNESVVAAAIQAGADYVVTLPADTDVPGNGTIVWQGHTFEVRAPADRTDPLVTRVYASGGG